MGKKTTSQTTQALGIELPPWTPIKAIKASICLVWKPDIIWYVIAWFPKCHVNFHYISYISYIYIYILLFFIISTLFHCMELRYRLLASQWGPHLHRSEKTQLWGIVPRLRSQSFELKPIIFPGLDKFNVLETTSPLYSVFDPRWPLCRLLHATILVFFSPDL